MGVAVANLALGGIVTTHSNRQRFAAVVDKTLFDQRVVGFSSNALLSLSWPATNVDGGRSG